MELLTEAVGGAVELAEKLVLEAGEFAQTDHGG